MLLVAAMPLARPVRKESIYTLSVSCDISGISCGDVKEVITDARSKELSETVTG